MDLPMDNIQIPYLPHVLYNQVQAVELWLDFREAILMYYFAYILPNWGECKTIKERNFYWLTYWKLFTDMPTLDFSEKTLRRIINKLIKIGVLEREIVWETRNQRAFYRAKKKFFVKDYTPPVTFDAAYKNVSEMLESGVMLSPEKKKLENLLSSYKGKAKKNTTTYNLEGVEGTPIMDYLRKEFELSEKWEGVEIDIWKEIDREFCLDLVDKIVKKWELKGWIPIWPDGKHTVTPDIKRKILSKLQDMFDWHKSHPKTGAKTKIKDFNWKVNTFFWRNAWL